MCYSPLYRLNKLSILLRCSLSCLLVLFSSHVVHADVVNNGSSSTVQGNTDSSRLRLASYSQQSASFLQVNQAFTQLIQQPAKPSSYVHPKPIVVYFINPTQQLSDYWRRNQIAFKSRLDELGIVTTIKLHDIKVNSPEAQKRELLSRALSNNPDFIMLTLETVPEVSFVASMMKTTKTRLIVQNVTKPIASWTHFQPLMYVGFDHEIGTTMLANYFSYAFPKGCTYAVNNYYPSYISQSRGDKFIASISEKTDFTMLSHAHTKATHGSARYFTRSLLSLHPEVDFIYASSTDIALGTSTELKSMGRDDIKVNGWGGGSEELIALTRGELAVTVMRMNDDSGVAMAEAVKLSLENKEHAIPLVYSGEFKLLTSETSIEQVAEFKKQAFRYSGVAPTKP